VLPGGVRMILGLGARIVGALYVALSVVWVVVA
jgi:hypothetical protein